MKRYLLIGSIFFIAGCSSIQSRIKDNERQFNNYPPEIQAQIQTGHIDHGFTEEMVYMAKGEPSEKSTMQKNGKNIVLWKYASPMPATPTSTSGSNVSTPYGYPNFGPGPSQPASVFYEKKYFKVEFENGRVVGWDQELNEK